MELKTVRVPETMIPLFMAADEYVKKYFSSYQAKPEEGTITIQNQRYILVRAESLRVDFAKHLGEAMGLEGEDAEDAAFHFLYILAKAIGKEDARYFCDVQKVSDPIAKLAAGPISFSYSGWAFVDIFPESRPSPDENYFLVYDHPYSFEAEAYMKKKKRKAGHCICGMNAGYSAGWCSESFSIEVDSKEILCRAKGDHACRFVMGVKGKLDEYAAWALNNIKK
ncbi:MAG: 4-vinyl reductase [Candidatus Aureabacteria bacterium]|nr:4-vinyl reductase [Candidatus Auribacterota bacterium]